MRLTRMMRSRKAISPILATLLLIVIAVAAIVVTYAWIMTYMSSAGQQAGVMLYKANVSFAQGATKTISVDVGNSGTSDTTLVKIYVGNSSAGRTEQTPSQALPLSLAKSTVVTMTVTYPWTAGTTYYFRILSSTGQSLEFPEQAPTS